MSKDENAKKNTADKIAEMMLCIPVTRQAQTATFSAFFSFFLLVHRIFKGHIKREITNVENIQIELYKMIR